jgi:hypothetical protein
MDFQYDNQTGQIDPTSPWLANQPAKKRKLNSFASEPTGTDYSRGDGQ